MREPALAPSAETTASRVAPPARARRAVATTKSRSTWRNASREPATLIVVPSATYASSTAGKSCGSRAKSTTCNLAFSCGARPATLRLTST